MPRTWGSSTKRWPTLVSATGPRARAEPPCSAKAIWKRIEPRSPRRRRGGWWGWGRGGGSRPFNDNVLPNRFARPIVNRYEPGMEYGVHVDNPLMGGAG